MENKDETKVPSNYELFMNAMKEIYHVAELNEQRQDDRKEQKEDAKEKLRKYAYDSMPKEIRPGKAEDLIEEYIPRYIELGLMLAKEKSANLLSKNLEEIVSEIPEESLENLPQRKEIMERASQKEKEVFDAYNQWKACEDFRKRYAAGKQLSDDETKVVRKLAGQGLADEVAKEFKDYSTDVQQAIMNLAYHTTEVGYVKNIKKYALPGLELAIEERKKNYENMAKEGGDVEEMSCEILKRMAKGNKKEFDIARALICESKK